MHLERAAILKQCIKSTDFKYSSRREWANVLIVHYVVRINTIYCIPAAGHHLIVNYPSETWIFWKSATCSNMCQFPDR